MCREATISRPLKRVNNLGNIEVINLNFVCISEGSFFEVPRPLNWTFNSNLRVTNRYIKSQPKEELGRWKFCLLPILPFQVFANSHGIVHRDISFGRMRQLPLFQRG